jgi:hypothetical protein
MGFAYSRLITYFIYMNVFKVSLFFLLLSLGFLQILCAQVFSSKQVPPEYSNISLPTVNERALIEREFKGAYNVTTSLPSNFVKDGSVDYTSFVQAALNKYPNVVFPNFPVLINKTGLTIQSNSKLYFPLNSKLFLQPNNMGAYEMLRIQNVSNVALYFPVLVGDRKGHSGKGGEWGMGISIKDSKNILIQKPRVNDCWGDGIYLGQISSSSSNIQIVKPFLNNNRRNGISIIAANGLKIDNAVIANTNGTSPMAGIDFEPNSNNEIIDGIIIDKPITFNNATHGILFALSNQSGKSQRNINIQINSPIDDQSGYGISFKLKQFATMPFTPKGLIAINNPTLKNNKIKSLLFYPGNLDNTVKVNISNPNFINAKAGQILNIKKEIQQNNKNILLQ